MCEKSDHKEAVGKLFNFPLLLAVKRDEEWDCASKSGGIANFPPTGDMTPDFSHNLDPNRPLIDMGTPQAVDSHELAPYTVGTATDAARRSLYACMT
jgi:hypothetical protein